MIKTSKANKDDIKYMVNLSYQKRKNYEDKGDVQFCVVAGNHDTAKYNFLEEFGLSRASRWYVGEI